MQGSVIKRAREARAAVWCAGLAASVVLAVGAAAQALPAGAADAAPAHHHKDLSEGIARHVQMHLDHLGERLEIKASQEPAWQAFASAFRDFHEAPADAGASRDGPVGAAEMTRRMAQHAAQRAQRLARLADATSALEQVLVPDQRQVLDAATRHFVASHFGGPGPMAGHGMLPDEFPNGGAMGAHGFHGPLGMGPHGGPCGPDAPHGWYPVPESDDDGRLHGDAGHGPADQ